MLWHLFRDCCVGWYAAPILRARHAHKNSPFAHAMTFIRSGLFVRALRACVALSTRVLFWPGAAEGTCERRGPSTGPTSAVGSVQKCPFRPAMRAVQLLHSCRKRPSLYYHTLVHIYPNTSSRCSSPPAVEALVIFMGLANRK